jgi:2-polyprenyl-6-methoxyphenol hydroxylase-like FAD-dependent oxidoreductase
VSKQVRAVSGSGEVASGQIRFDQLGIALSRYSSPLIYPQDLHEEMLIERLSSLNVRVERETELVDLISSKDGVSATLRKAAHSTVREKLQINFPGGTYSDLFYVADIQARGPAIHSPIRAIVYAKEPDFWNKGCQVKSIHTGFRSLLSWRGIGTNRLFALTPWGGFFYSQYAGHGRDQSTKALTSLEVGQFASRLDALLLNVHYRTNRRVTP